MVLKNLMVGGLVFEQLEDGSIGVDTRNQISSNNLYFGFDYKESAQIIKFFKELEISKCPTCGKERD